MPHYYCCYEQPATQTLFTVTGPLRFGAIVKTNGEAAHEFQNEHIINKNTFCEHIGLSDKLDSKALQHSRRNIISNRFYYSLP